MGDGMNDAAAPKQAHVSVSMGSGTAIAKEASDIILLDDSVSQCGECIALGSIVGASRVVDFKFSGSNSTVQIR